MTCYKVLIPPTLYNDNIILQELIRKMSSEKREIFH